jgi:phage terminase large subunit
LWGESWKAKDDELLKSCTRVYHKALGYGADVDYDSIGVGAMAGAKFSDLNKERDDARLIGRVGYNKFNAGGKVVGPDDFYIDADEEKVTNKDFFANIKAQAWWLVADRFRNTYNAVTKGEKYEDDELISISSDMPNLANLITELSTPRRDFDKAGRVKVESKEDLAKRDVPSPNDGDAFIMCFSPKKINKLGSLLQMAMGGNR